MREVRKTSKAAIVEDGLVGLATPRSTQSIDVRAVPLHCLPEAEFDMELSQNLQGELSLHDRAIALIDSLVQSPQTEHSLSATAATAMAALFGERASCILVEGRTRVVASTADSSVINLPIDLARYPEISLAFEKRDILTIENVWSDPRLESIRALLPVRLHSITVVPLFQDARPLGALTAVSCTAQPLDSATIRLATLIGRLTSRLLTAIYSLSTRRISCPRTPAGTLAPRTRHRLLVVDDDRDIRDTLRALLEAEGYDVAVAANGEEGFKKARQSEPDLILLDVRMPVVDGLAAAERLHNDEVMATTPLLFLSAADELGVRVKTFKLGATDFIAKPIVADDLLARVRRTLAHADMTNQLREQARLDPLTSLGNVRYLTERLAIEEERWRRYPSPTSMLMIDVDKLKHLNDRLGHVAASEILAKIGGILNEQARATDVVIRYGGDEFVVLLPQTSVTDAVAVANRIQVRIAELGEHGHAVTVSVGVAGVDGNSTRSGKDLLQRADAAVYRAKREGGNCVRVDAALLESGFTDLWTDPNNSCVEE